MIVNQGETRTRGGIHTRVVCVRLTLPLRPRPHDRPRLVCVCVCVFLKLHITTQSGPVILVILCHSH